MLTFLKQWLTVLIMQLSLPHSYVPSCSTRILFSGIEIEVFTWSSDGYKA